MPTTSPLSNNLFRLLELRYRDPHRFESLVLDQNTANVAFLRANDTEALKGYLTRVAKGDGVEAWVGLLLVRRRLSNRANDWPMQERPELLAAVHERLRVLTGKPPDTEVLIEWLESGG